VPHQLWQLSEELETCSAYLATDGPTFSAERPVHKIAYPRSDDWLNAVWTGRYPRPNPSLMIDRGHALEIGVETGIDDCTHGPTLVSSANHKPLACKRLRSDVSARLTTRPASSV
jgi:hypothetical protein